VCGCCDRCVVCDACSMRRKGLSQQPRMKPNGVAEIKKCPTVIPQRHYHRIQRAQPSYAVQQPRRASSAVITTYTHWQRARAVPLLCTCACVSMSRKEVRGLIKQCPPSFGAVHKENDGYDVWKKNTHTHIYMYTKSFTGLKRSTTSVWRGWVRRQKRSPWRLQDAEGRRREGGVTVTVT